jgi:hypothetical protein
MSRSIKVRRFQGLQLPQAEQVHPTDFDILDIETFRERNPLIHYEEDIRTRQNLCVNTEVELKIERIKILSADEERINSTMLSQIVRVIITGFTPSGSYVGQMKGKCSILDLPDGLRVTFDPKNVMSVLRTIH